MTKVLYLVTTNQASSVVVINSAETELKLKLSN